MSRLLHRNLREPPVEAVRGEGMFLITRDGQRIIDGSGGAAVACIGHGDARVAEAVAAQMARLSYAHTGRFTTEAAEALAEHLTAAAPGGLAHVYLTGSGSEAMEAALKLARQHFVETGQPERTQVIARRQSYHGNTLGALAAGGNAARRAVYAPMLAPAFHHVSPCFAYRGQSDGETDAAYVARLAAELEAAFQRIGPDRVMAFCAETVVGATTGCVAALPGYFAAVRAICDRHGALLVLDEVMCGMGRTGSLHAWEQEGVAPDIQTIAKGLGGGYQPIGAVLASERVVAPLRAGSGGFAHGQTYEAHPVACAAALAVQRVLQEEGLVARAASLGHQLGEGLARTLGQHPHVGDVRGRGLFWATELVADRDTKAPFPPALRLHRRIADAALTRGLAVYPMGGTIDGTQGDHVLVAPPFIATETDIDTIVDRLAEATTHAIASL